MREVATQLSLQLVPVVERLVLSIYSRHQEHYAVEDLVGHVEAAVGGTRRPTDPDAICFLDLTDYTRLTEERGDAAAASVVRALAGVVDQSTAIHGGRPVKWLGDGVMLHFDRPPRAVRAALEMVERGPEAGLPPAHVGIHAGPVVFQDADYYGRTVNLAARVAAHAGPQQVLVTDAVKELTSDEVVSFRPLGAVPLKGVAEPVSLHEATRA
jgi:class 3 adenylate cyclase